MFRYQTTNFDLDQIADSGQCFRMLPVKHVPHAYTAVSGGHVLYVRKTPGLSGKTILTCRPITPP